MKENLIDTTGTRRSFRQPVIDDDKLECKKFMAKHCAVNHLKAEDCAKL